MLISCSFIINSFCLKTFIGYDFLVFSIVCVELKQNCLFFYFRQHKKRFLNYKKTSKTLNSQTQKILQLDVFLAILFHQTKNFCDCRRVVVKYLDFKKDLWRCLVLKSELSLQQIHGVESLLVEGGGQGSMLPIPRLKTYSEVLQ